MTVKEAMQKIIDEDMNDKDFCDDYDERAYCAYCGNHWSEDAEKEFARAFNLEVDDFTDDADTVIVHCETAKDAQALSDLLYAMAGYISEKEYDRLFPEPEVKEPERSNLEVILTSGKIINAKWVDFDCQHGCIDILGMDDEWYPYKMTVVFRIIGRGEVN